MNNQLQCDVSLIKNTYATLFKKYKQPVYTKNNYLLNPKCHADLSHAWPIKFKPDEDIIFDKLRNIS